MSTTEIGRIDPTDQSEITPLLCFYFPGSFVWALETELAPKILHFHPFQLEFIMKNSFHLKRDELPTYMSAWENLTEKEYFIMHTA
jgi:hypothetical protein